MTRNENQLTSLPFYTAEKYQDRQKWWVQSVYKLLSLKDRFIPFQIVKSIINIGGGTCGIPATVDYNSDFSGGVDGWEVSYKPPEVTVNLSASGGILNAACTTAIPNNPYFIRLRKVITGAHNFAFNSCTYTMVLEGSSADSLLTAFDAPGGSFFANPGVSLDVEKTLTDTINGDNTYDYVELTLVQNAGSNETFQIKTVDTSSTPYELYIDENIYSSDWSLDTDGWDIALLEPGSLSAANSRLVLDVSPGNSSIIEKTVSYSRVDIRNYTIKVDPYQSPDTILEYIEVRGTRDGEEITRIHTVNHSFSTSQVYENTFQNSDNFDGFTRIRFKIVEDGSSNMEFDEVTFDANYKCQQEQLNIWTIAELIDVETGNVTDVSTYMNANTELVTFASYQVAIYKGGVALGTPMSNGFKYLKLSDGVDTWYSEVFQPCDDPSRFVKVEWWRDEDLVYTGGRIVYTTGFINTMYLDADIAKPSYQYELEETERDGYEFREKTISYKQFAFEAILPESIIDVLSRLPNHEYVMLYYNDITYRTISIEMEEPEWEEHGDLAITPFKFKTDTVVTSGTDVSATVNELLANEDEAINIRGNNKRIFQLGDVVDFDDLFLPADKDSLSEAVRIPFSEVAGLKGPVDYIDFTPQDEADVGYTEGRAFYDINEKTWTFYNDLPDTALQLGEELRARLENDTGATLNNGIAVSITGAIGIRLKIELLDASDFDSSIRAFGLVTQDIVNGTEGYTVRFGLIRGVDTSAFAQGDIIYGDPATPGGLTNVRPKAPNYPVVFGVCVVSDPTNGVYGVDTRAFNGSDTSVNFEGALNGVVVETPAVNFYESGGNLFVEVTNQNEPTNDLAFVLDGTRYLLNTTSGGGPNGGAFAQLTPGANSTTFFENFVYVWINSGVPELKVSTLASTDTLAPIGLCALWDYTRTIAEGEVYKWRRYNDAPDNGPDDGFIRWSLDLDRDKLGTTYTSGIDPTITVNSTPTVKVETTAGVAMQAHRGTFDAQDGTKYWIYNNNANVATYELVSDLASIVETANGESLAVNGRYYRLRVYGMQNSSSGGDLSTTDKLIVTRPLGYYVTAAEAIVDASNFDVAPNDIVTEGVLFRLFTLVIGRTGGGGATWTLIEWQDNRSRLIGGIGGGGAGSTGTGTDDKVRVTQNDSTNSYLDDKIQVVANELTKAIQNPAANENILLGLASAIVKNIDFNAGLTVDALQTFLDTNGLKFGGGTVRVFESALGVLKTLIGSESPLTLEQYKVQIGDAFNYTASSANQDFVVGMANKDARFFFGDNNSRYGGMLWDASAERLTILNNRAGTQIDIQAGGVRAAAITSEVQKFEGQAVGGDRTIGYSASMTFNMNDGNTQQVTVTGNIASWTISNAQQGGAYTVYFIQDATGGHTIADPTGITHKMNESLPGFDTSPDGITVVNIFIRPDGGSMWSIVGTA